MKKNSHISIVLCKGIKHRKFIEVVLTCQTLRSSFVTLYLNTAFSVNAHIVSFNGSLVILISLPKDWNRETKLKFAVYKKCTKLFVEQKLTSLKPSSNTTSSLMREIPFTWSEYRSNAWNSVRMKESGAEDGNSRRFLEPMILSSPKSKSNCEKTTGKINRFIWCTLSIINNLKRPQ